MRFTLLSGFVAQILNLTRMAPLPHYLSEALYSLQLRARRMGFFMAENAYHVSASATLHSDSRNKALL
jgi:hypothetical protein